MKFPAPSPQLEDVFAQAPGSVAVLSPDLRIALVNDAYLRASHLSRSQLLGKLLFDVFPDNPDVPETASVATLKASLERVLATGLPDEIPVQRYDVRKSEEDGGDFEERYWRVLNYPIINPDGVVTHVVHQAEEVTELVLLRKDHRKRLDELTETLNVNQAIYDQGLFAGRIDRNGVVIDANRSSLEHCGFRREDVIGKLFWDCGWWNRSAEVQAWVKAAFEQALRGEPFRGRSTYFWADGSEHLVEFACMPIKDKTGNVLCVVPTGLDITERAEAEKAKQAGLILESITDAFCALDRDWKFAYVNHQAEILLSRTSSDLLGKVVWDEFPGLEGSDFRRTFLQTVDEQVATTITSFYPDHNRWYEVRSFPSAEGIAVYFRDVSERIRAESEQQRILQESEKERRMYHAALSNTPDLVYVFDLDHKFIYVNEALLKMWGRTSEDALGKTCLELGYEPWHAQMHDNEIDQVAATGLPLRGEVPFTGTSGRRIYDYIFVPVFGVDGKVQAVAGTTRDVTERKEAEQVVSRLNVELARRVRELQSIFDTAPVGINVADDPECKVIRGNEVLSNMLGMTSGQNVSMSRTDRENLPYAIFKDGRKMQPHELPMQRSVSERRRVEDVIEIERADGSRITVLTTAKPILDEHRRVLGSVGICVDVTRLREVEEELRQTSRRKDEFLAMLAHELRNPLAAVGNAVTVLKVSRDPENLQFAQEIIERQTKQLARLIEDLLDVSRITSGKIRLRRELVDAGPILSQAIQSVSPLIDERKHALIAEYSEGSLPLRVDPTRIEQVIVNLLTNAAKYTECQGLIRLTADREGDQIVISVEDNGMGIPPDKVPEMFDLFSQGERSIARSEGGLGIGLTIVQKLVEMHGGTVSASSEGMGKGSKFSIRLPAARQSQLARSDTSAPSPRTGARILVVDDSLDTARGMVKLLRLLGNEVLAVHDGPAALEAAREIRPEFVLLDIGLPGMDGYEVASRLRQEASARGAVIIAISGYGQEDDRRRSREAGFDHHLVKPVDFDSLTSLMARSGSL